MVGSTLDNCWTVTVQCCDALKCHIEDYKCYCEVNTITVMMCPTLFTAHLVTILYCDYSSITFNSSLIFINSIVLIQ